MSTAASDNRQAGLGRPLPKKEADIFKNVVKHYEMKQYKKAIKQADIILKKFPNHGETLAMKGLTLNYMNKKEEARTLVKQGLMNDMRSHVCWHVYGLLHRSDRDYNEAIKAYKQALRVDPENLQILRDLSMLQIQMRDLEGFSVTRNTLLNLKPNAKINWMAFALARHLTGDLQGAAKVIDIYLGTLTEGSSELGRSYESSELALYKNSILAEIPNNHRDALDHLQTCESIVVDRGAWLLQRAEYQLKLKEYEPTKETVYQLFDRGMTENHKIHSLFMCALLEIDDDKVIEDALSLKGTQTLATMIPLSDEQKKKIFTFYKTELEPKFPKSYAVHRIPTTVLDGKELQDELDKCCRQNLRKGVPSLCSELRSFLWTEVNHRFVRADDPADVRPHPIYRMIVDMVDGYVSNLEKISKFDSEEETDEDPSTLLWAWFLRAGLHELAGEYEEGIILLDRCLEHTPTAVDVYELKGRLLKACGNIKEAAACLDKGRELDKQDRYINNQTTKYMLQAGMDEEALKRISLFTRHEGNPEQNLYDMQCCWYELELAACLAAKKDWGRSLKKYSAVVKHFDDFQEDQFDFHSYCLRKVTLRAYVRLLRFEDAVYGHDFFRRAASGIIRIYLRIFDKPVNEETNEPDYSKMSADERKKAKAIARKKKANEKKEAASKTKQIDANQNGGKKNINNNKGNKNASIEDDPNGEEFLKCSPLDEAKKYSLMLSKYAPSHLGTWVLQYDVAIRRCKPMLALQALFKGKSINPESADIFTRIVDFAGKLNDFKDVSSPAKVVLSEEFPRLLEQQSVADFIHCAATKIRENPLTDLPMRVAVVQAAVSTQTIPTQEAVSLILDGGMDCRKVSVETCQQALTLLKNLGNDACDATKRWLDAFVKRFPSAAIEE